MAMNPLVVNTTQWSISAYVSMQYAQVNGGTAWPLFNMYVITNNQ